MPEPWRTATKLSGMYHPRGQIFFGMRLPLLLQPRKAKAAFAKIHSWRPERIVLSHGRCFESHGNEVIRRIFGGTDALKVRLIQPRREPISAFWHLTDIRVRSADVIPKAIRPQAYYRRSMESTSQGRHRGLTVIGVLMILFGGAEVITGFTHKFFDISTAIGVPSTFLASGIGTLYAVAGLLVVTMRRWAASLALACLVVVVAGRIALVVTGLFPLDSFEQTFAITVGTGIAASFAIYIGCKWRAFR
jgi:hypothetical protein